MAYLNRAALESSIENVIKPNDNREITATLHQALLKDVNDSIRGKLGYADATELRAETIYSNKLIAFITGGGGSLFSYDETSALADDGVNVIKPTAVTSNGRWLLKSSFTNNTITFYDTTVGVVESGAEYQDLILALNSGAKRIKFLSNLTLSTSITSHIVNGNYLFDLNSYALTVDNVFISGSFLATPYHFLNVKNGRIIFNKSSGFMFTDFDEHQLFVENCRIDNNSTTDDVCICVNYGTFDDCQIVVAGKGKGFGVIGSEFKGVVKNSTFFITTAEDLIYSTLEKTTIENCYFSGSALNDLINIVRADGLKITSTSTFDIICKQLYNFNLDSGSVTAYSNLVVNAKNLFNVKPITSGLRKSKVKDSNFNNNLLITPHVDSNFTIEFENCIFSGDVETDVIGFYVNDVKFYSCHFSGDVLLDSVTKSYVKNSYILGNLTNELDAEFQEISGNIINGNLIINGCCCRYLNNTAFNITITADKNTLRDCSCNSITVTVDADDTVLDNVTYTNTYTNSSITNRKIDIYKN